MKKYATAAAAAVVLLAGCGHTTVSPTVHNDQTPAQVRRVFGVEQSAAQAAGSLSEGAREIR